MSNYWKREQQHCTRWW